MRLYQELLEVGSPKPNVLAIDGVSPSLLAGHLLDLRSRIGATDADYLPELIAADTVADRLVALPYSLSFGLLFYRRELLARSAMPVPDTWDGLERAAAVVQDQERNTGNARFWGFLWQSERAEILTCNAPEWIASCGGGTIVAASGRVTIDNQLALIVLQRAPNWRWDHLARVPARCHRAGLGGSVHGRQCRLRTRLARRVAAFERRGINPDGRPMARMLLPMRRFHPMDRELHCLQPSPGPRHSGDLPALLPQGI